MGDARIISSQFNIIITFKVWIVDIVRVADALVKAGFASLPNEDDDSPMGAQYVNNSGTTVSFDTGNRRLALSVINSKTPEVNLNQVLSVLLSSDIPYQELLERVDVIGALLASSPSIPRRVFENKLSPELLAKTRRELGHDLVPIGVTLSSASSLNIYDSGVLSVVLNPLYTDTSKFLVQINYSSREAPEIVRFVKDIGLKVTNLMNVI